MSCERECEDEDRNMNKGWSTVYIMFWVADLEL